jgi:hypothetical protein
MTAARVASDEANDQLTRALINAAARGLRPRCPDVGTKTSTWRLLEEKLQ